MPELMWPGVPYLFTEEQETREPEMEGQKTESRDAGLQGYGRIDYQEMIRKLYAVEELQGYTEEEISVAKKYFGSIPQTLEEFWQRAARTEAILLAYKRGIGACPVRPCKTTLWALWLAWNGHEFLQQCRKLMEVMEGMVKHDKRTQESGES